MDEQYITGLELIALVVIGSLIPWIIATMIQIHIYKKHGISFKFWVISSVVLFICTATVGLALWAAVPVLTVAWQHIVLRVPSTLINVLAVVPLFPMAAAALVSAVPITLFFLKRYGNA